MFPAKTYRDRRERLQTTLKSGLILLPGNGESPMNYADNWYPFKQDSTFLYYTGLNGISDLYFLIDIDNDMEILFGKDATPEEMVWTGAAEPIADLAEKSGIATVKPLKELEAYVKQQRQKGQEIHYLPPYRAELTIHLAALLGMEVGEVAENKSVELIKAVVAQREIKTDEELVEIEKAVNTTVAMHTYAIKNTWPGRTELEIAGELQAIAIGGGGNIAFPHHPDQKRTIFAQSSYPRHPGRGRFGPLRLRCGNCHGLHGGYDPHLSRWREVQYLTA